MHMALRHRRDIRLWSQRKGIFAIGVRCTLVAGVAARWLVADR
jgi:hypothetical protein